jgi:hypothetical protein
MGGEFYSTLTELVRLGSAGVGIAVFLMVFILLMRGKPMDKATARLREKFLIYGVAFAVFCGVASFLGPLLQKDEQKPAGPVKLRLAFSPDFGTESLTPPKVQLPDGSASEPGKVFNIPHSDVPQVLTIGMDGPLKEVRSLRSTTTALAQSVAAVQEQRDQLAASIPATTPAAPEAQSDLAKAAQQSEALQQDVVQSINRGDFDQAAIISQRLRANVGRSAPTVARIARPTQPPVARPLVRRPPAN